VHSLLPRLGKPIYSVAALGAGLVWADLANALDRDNGDPLTLFQPGEEATNGVGSQPPASAICATVAPSGRRSRSGPERVWCSRAGGGSRPPAVASGRWPLAGYGVGPWHWAEPGGRRISSSQALRTARAASRRVWPSLARTGGCEGVLGGFTRWRGLRHPI
jgi:hypothetical protein